LKYALNIAQHKLSQIPNSMTTPSFIQEWFTKQTVAGLTEK